MVRRLTLRVAVLMITCGVGIGLDRLISNTPSLEPPQVQNCQPVALPTFVETVEAVSSPPPPPVAVESPNTILDYNPDKFYPEGGYSLTGVIPKEFRHLLHFTLESSEKVDGRSGYIGITTASENEADYHLAVFGLVTKKRVFWVSPIIDGVQYRFDGEFLNVNFEAAANTNKSVLRGTLTKTRDGRTVVERVVSFRLEYDVC